jgi:ATP-dependent Lon protease
MDKFSLMDSNQEINSLVTKIKQNAMPNDLKERALGQVTRLYKMINSGEYSRDYESVMEYLNWLLRIPWEVFLRDNLDLNNVKESLNKNHYGLEPVKNRILEYIAIMNLKQKKFKNISENVDKKDKMVTQKSSSEVAPILCFVGIQGVGKTSMAKSIAQALGRPFVRISLGGVNSSSELRGLSRGEVGAEPGQIIKSLVRTKIMNPLILLDEIDKVSKQSGARADVMASLLEILDPQQNSTFIDRYIDYPVDISQVFFITTANNLGGISAALLDRLEIIRFGSYSDEEKIVIARDYLLKKVVKNAGLSPDQIQFSDDVWPLVVRPLGFDAGVRQLERTLSELARKVALQVVQGVVDKVLITKENFRDYIPEDFAVYS